MPYFVALERLEAEKTVLMQERNRFLRELKERAEDISAGPDLIPFSRPSLETEHSLHLIC